jgi:choline-sulfatase
VVKTPAVDSLCAEGVRFPNAYTTSPVCMPARSSFLSGQYCHNHGQWSNYGHLPEDADTYLRHVKRAGYRTCHIGKSHLYPHAGRHLNEALPFMRALGWDDVFETTGPHATRTTDSIMTDRWKQLGCLDTFRDDYRRRSEADWIATWPSPMPKGEHADDFVGRTAVEYLSECDRSEPWLAFVGFGGPHEPWDPPAEWAAQYDWTRMNEALPPLPPDPWLSPAAAEHQRRLQHVDLRYTPELVARIRALYFAKISHVDHWVGRIREALERSGQWENTAVIFWSDHGEMLGDRGRYHKSVFYEPSARVPFVLRLPGREAAGAVRPHLVSLVDAFPTILELTGCPARAHEFGRSLLAPARDPVAAHHGAVFSEIDSRTMVRDARHKMVLDDSGRVLKLYDLQADPDESCNLAGRPDSEPVEQRLRGHLLAWHLLTPSRYRHLHGAGR